MKFILLFVAFFLFACSEEPKEETDCSSSSAQESQNDSLQYQGKFYKTVKIGSQVWMAENLNFSSGNSWCYSEIEENCEKYGMLYDFETAKTVCPSGWKLPSKTDFDALLDFVENRNENAFAGIMLKAADGWENNGTDLFGFTALPSGLRNSDGTFMQLGKQAFFWTSTETGDQAYYRNLRNDENLYSGLSSKTLGYSVRCVKK